MAEVMDIRSSPCPQCALCGQAGNFLHLSQRDRLFGAAGSWNLKECSNRRCGLIWLDPMPLEEDIGKAYANYYTHRPPALNEGGPAGLLRRCYRSIKLGYLADKYGYGSGEAHLPVRLAGRLLYLLPWRRSRADSEIRCLRAVPQGRLLDMGCGSGEWLLFMRALGWQAEGVDFDQSAASAAAQCGLTVRLGTLEHQNFPSGSFDAITMSHVIEHLPDPVRTLAEVARVLKPGGQLVLWTPNAASLGHRVFKNHWRGLEPPRHLHLFSPQSMELLVRAAGLHLDSIRSRNSRFIWEQSMILWARDHPVRRRFARKSIITVASCALVIVEASLLLAKSPSGEWLDVRASRS